MNKEQSGLQAKIEKSWETLGISNDFLFGKLMRKHPGLCQKLLQRILPELPIGRIEILETQKIIDEDVDARSVRLDVYARDDEARAYSVEMQMMDTKELPKRSRYYSAMIDMQLLDKAVTYRHLNDTYIIFICPFDLYGKGRHKYTFDGSCKEDPEVKIGDGTTRIFLNARGTMDDVDARLKAFLDYMLGIVGDDVFIQELEHAVAEARKNREWRHEYMTLQLRDQENIEKGIEKEREESIRVLITTLKELGIPNGKIISKVHEKYHLTEQEIEQYLKRENMSH